MAVANRQTIINKLNRVLRKHYKPVKGTNLPVMETLLYAACLEDAPQEAAEKAYEELRKVSFDLNEVRVTTVAELAELMPQLPFPRRSAGNVKRLLQSIFESQYSYDLEHLKKQNLGKAEQQLRKYEGASPFIVGYVVQNSLGGHSIPIGRGSLECLYITGVIDEKEKEKWQTPGLERTIPKNKGVEFGSLLHQLGADLVSSPYGPKIKAILLEINAAAKDRLPKRITKKQREAALKKEAEAKKAAAKAAADAKKAEAKKSADAKRAAAKKAADDKAAKRKAAKKKADDRTKKKTSKKKTTTKKKPAKKKTVVKKKKKPKTKTTTKRKTVKKKKKKKATKRITRRKPR